MKDKLFLTHIYFVTASLLILHLMGCQQKLKRKLLKQASPEKQRAKKRKDFLT